MPRRMRQSSSPPMPGLNPEDLEITYTQNTLTLSGSVPNVAESEQGQNATWYLRELWSGQFQRTVTLPFEVDASKAEATFEHGIVRITLPKADGRSPRRSPSRPGVVSRHREPAPAARAEGRLRTERRMGRTAGRVPGRSPLLVRHVASGSTRRYVSQSNALNRADRQSCLLDPGGVAWKPAEDNLRVRDSRYSTSGETMGHAPAR